MSDWGIVGQPWNATNITTVGSGGDPAAAPSGQSALDRARRGANRLGEADYPAGYLGTYQSRQQGKENPAEALLRDRLGERAYQRGIHRDTKQPMSAYYWPDWFSPDSGLINQMQARRSGNVILTPRFTSQMDPVERYMHGRAPIDTPDTEMAAVFRRYGVNPESATDPERIDPVVARVVSKYLPDTSW